MWPFTRKQAASPTLENGPPPVISIIVSQSMVDSDDPHYLPCAVVDYVNDLIRAAYQRDELPQEAMWSYHVDYYLAQVNNGGHGQFIHNSGWLAAMVADIRHGLTAMGIAEALAIFTELEQFALDHPAHFRDAAEGGGFGEIDPIIRDLDDRFFAGPSEAIPRANGAWLRGLPNLVAVPHTERPEIMKQIAAANTAFEWRNAARERAAREAQDRDPLAQALEQLLSHAQPRLNYLGWTAGFPRKTDRGATMHIFGISTDSGVVQAFLSGQEAVLTQGFGGAVLARMPMSKLDRAVKKKTGQSIEEVLDFG